MSKEMKEKYVASGGERILYAVTKIYVFELSHTLCIRTHMSTYLQLLDERG